ncbi:UBN2_3 domain-containing protein [Cephalotus follicularis]|uniref:UBN2_3 domain-containing protein n=1 Tax=Cephalotus follicularis TaxID=3775 RepID=A0A1Q3AR49_CEPFO|nr:UBN2_3 domain-containing protein [Cephalotus follicularis]
MQFLDGSTTPPASDDPTYRSWYEKDQMLLSWINATLSESAIPYIVGVTSSKEAYASITPSHIMGLKRQLHRIKKRNLSMHDYLQQIKSLTDQLAACGSPVGEDCWNRINRIRSQKRT